MTLFKDVFRPLEGGAQNVPHVCGLSEQRVSYSKLEWFDGRILLV